MRVTRLAEEYAQALFSLAHEQGIDEQVYKDLSSTADVLGDNRQFLYFVQSPAIPYEQKAELVAHVFHCEKLTKYFYELLLRRKVFHLLPGIKIQYKKLYDDARGIAAVNVVSASPLDKEKQETVKKTLHSLLKRTIAPEYSVDPDLIAGLVVRYGDKILDGSLKTQFSLIKEELVKERK